MMPMPSGPTRRRLIGLALAGAASSALAGCAPWSGLPALPPRPPGPYRLGTGDRLRITVFGQKQMTGIYAIDATGQIDLPLLGTVRAAGRTPGGLRRAIVRGLVARGILRQPSVAVEVTTYRPFSILGEVNKPDQYPFQPGMTVLAAVALAGGFTYRAAESQVGIVRVVRGIARNYRAPVSALVEPGDVIRVFQRHF